MLAEPAMKYMFITGMGRSGTGFTSRLLSSIPSATVRHEYIPHQRGVTSREYVLASWFLGSEYAVPYLRRKREEIERAFSTSWFVDVDAGLRHSVPALREVFPEAVILHQVRDPRDAVRSIFTRRVDSQVHQVPRSRSEVERWLLADKFERVCKDWASTTEQLLNEGLPLLQLERLTEDFDYVQERMSRPYGLPVTESSWDAIRHRKVNSTKSKFLRYAYAKLKGKQYVTDQLPTFQNWTAAQKDMLIEICGPIARECGYELGT